MSGNLDNIRRPRQYIPTTLHSELTEYSSLLRALRTNSILDVSHHLAQHGKADSSSSEDSDQDSDESSSASDEPATGEKRKRRDEPVRKRDKWTRWPLLLNDLHKPTWSFQDEIAIVASQALKLVPPPPFSQEELRSEDNSPGESGEISSQDDYDDQHNELEMDVDDPDRQFYFNYIGMSASTFLSNILALLSSNIPPRPPSMQNRIEPVDWRSILEIVSVVADEELINKVKARMEKLYDLPPGSSFPQTEEGESLITYRLRKKAEAKQRLENMVSHADGLFTLAEPPDGVKRKLKKSKRSLRSLKKAPGTRTRAQVYVKSKRGRKTKEIISSDESEEQPLALTLKKRKVKVGPRPTEEEPKGKISDHIGANDDMDHNVSSHDIPLCDNEPIHEPSPRDSTNAEETAS